MNARDTTASALIDFLRSAPGVAGPIHLDTDLLESGCLDSLLVMDLVCFLQAHFQITMRPADINPHNLRSVRRLACYVQGELAGAPSSS